MTDFMDQIEEYSNPAGKLAKILVIGVGGGGGNAVANMLELGLDGVDFIAANTDMQALGRNPAPTRIQLGAKLTKGLGAGSRPEVGRNAAEESIREIEDIVKGAEMVFITAGMGGGTGTGAAPVIAEAARKAGCLTVGVVTRPFGYEGRQRAAVADAGIQELSKQVDCMLTIPNDRVLSFAPKRTPLRELMAKVNDILYFGVKGISDVITCEGYMNVDFADVRTCMVNSGRALMGMGAGVGENRAEDAVTAAISSPMLEDVSLSRAKSVLYNVTAPDDITGEEMELIGDRIHDQVGDNTLIKYGVLFDEDLEDEIRVTVIATGIDPAPTIRMRPASVGDGFNERVRRERELLAPEKTRTNPAQAAPAAPQKPDAGYDAGAFSLGNGSEAPSFLHHEGRSHEAGIGPVDAGLSESDLEIPAFIRRQAD